MTPEAASYVLESVWIGFLTAKVRLLKICKETQDLKGNAAHAEIEQLREAMAFLEEANRRVNAWTSKAVCLETPEKSIVSWPVEPPTNAREAVFEKYLKVRPESYELLKNEHLNVKALNPGSSQEAQTDAARLTA